MFNFFSVPISITSKSQALAVVSHWLRQWRILNTEYRIPNGKYRIPNTEYRMADSEFPARSGYAAGVAGGSIQNSVLFPKIVVTPNPEMIVAAQTDPEFLKALQSADLAIPDGIGIIWALKHLSLRGLRRGGGRGNLNKRFPRDVPSGTSLGMTDIQISNLSRLSGLDFMESLVALASQKGWKVMFLGGKPGVAEKAAVALRRKFSIQYSVFSIKPIVGPQNISTISKSENDRLITSINQFQPDLLFVAFGHGKQEKWLTKNRHRLNAGVAMGVGGALDQIADPSLRPPAYINSIGLGWLYRLLREPRRWRRQLALVKFVGMVFRQKLQIPNF